MSNTMVKEAKNMFKKILITVAKIYFYSFIVVGVLAGVIAIAIKSDGVDTYEINTTKK